MKLSTQQDVNAPVDVVFDQMSDFAAFEHMMMRRGGRMVRTDNLPEIGPGVTWDFAFKFRGHAREATATLVEYTPPTGMGITAQIGGLSSNVTIDVLALSASRSRMVVGVDLKPQTLTARLLVQSLKLAKASLTRKFKDRVAGYAADIERQYQSAA